MFLRCYGCWISGLISLFHLNFWGDILIYEERFYTMFLFEENLSNETIVWPPCVIDGKVNALSSEKMQSNSNVVYCQLEWNFGGSYGGLLIRMLISLHICNFVLSPLAFDLNLGLMNCEIARTIIVLRDRTDSFS